jgi:ribonuclease HII
MYQVNPHLKKMTSFLIAGIDEAGRGALAGPVVAGACIITVPLFRRRHSIPRWSPFSKKRDDDCFIADSKSLTPDERERTFAWLIEHCPIGFGIADAAFIESYGILKATQHAMRLALEHLRQTAEPRTLFIDGRDAFSFDIPHRSIIRGDQLEPCIAAGSIVAKVTRDRMMKEYCPRFPAYGFSKHKGYGSDEHILAIRSHGPCDIHRRSFLQRILHKQPLLAL